MSAKNDKNAKLNMKMSESAKESNKETLKINLNKNNDIDKKENKNQKMHKETLDEKKSTNNNIVNKTKSNQEIHIKNSVKQNTSKMKTKYENDAKRNINNGNIENRKNNNSENVKNTNINNNKKNIENRNISNNNEKTENRKANNEKIKNSKNQKINKNQDKDSKAQKNINKDIKKQIANKETKEEQVVFNNKKKKDSQKQITNKLNKENQISQIKNDIKLQNINNKKNKQDLNNKENLKNKQNKSKVKNEKNDSKTNNINTLEFFEEKDNNKRKAMLILINIVSVLIILLIFSTIFAIIHTTKPVIAKGISIKNIDVSNLTYNEAKEKLEEAFNIVLDVNIELKYSDYSYIIKSKDISLVYSLKNALDEAYKVGRDKNIVKSNYSLIKTAILKKNINFDLEYNDEEINQIINEVSASIPNLVKQYSYYIEGDELIINPGADGVRVNTDKLKDMIKTNILNRNPLELAKDFKNSIIEIPYEDVKADNIDLEKIYNEVHSEPKDAYYTEATETTNFAIYKDVDGIDFAISMEDAKNIISQEGLSEYVIPLSRKKANVTINNIGIEAFPYEISKYTTSYDASNLSRSENLRIAASKINGTVIMPGEQFSFNGVVGERTVAEGYKDAKIYSDGQVVDGLAGGICQISSTLYNAALEANLQIDERYNHSFTTTYVKEGRDATVVYGIKDLKFTNNRAFPIKIEASVANGIALFKIYGIQEEKEYKVNIIPVVLDTYPYTTQTITDYSLAPGTMVVKQAGASGYKVATYKEVSLNGVIISKELISNDTYKTMTRIVRVGPQVEPVVENTNEPIVE